MNDQELLRYSRHLLLAEIGIEGQARIRGATVLVVGAGGLGQMLAFHLGLFQMHKTAAVLLGMLGMVACVDALSQQLRQRLL
jgi:ABC-type phosphate/phosphonate transport system permease subunit